MPVRLPHGEVIPVALQRARYAAFFTAARSLSMGKSVKETSSVISLSLQIKVAFAVFSPRITVSSLSEVSPSLKLSLGKKIRQRLSGKYWCSVNLDKLRKPEHREWVQQEFNFEYD
jgi:hypothetical protein